MNFEEFDDLISEFIHENIDKYGHELSFSKKYKENLKVLFEEVKK